MIAKQSGTTRSASRRRGLSLVEMIISIALVGMGLVAALNAVGLSRLSQFKVSSSHRGLLLAQDLMTEILTQDYADAVLGKDDFSLPPEKDTGNRSLFNDVDDYDTWTASPPQYKDGTEMSHLPDWTRKVDVKWVSPADLQDSGTATGVKEIRVKVTRNGEQTCELVALKTVGLPPLEACCFGDGTCADLRVEACAAEGGTSLGPDTRCVTTKCPTGAKLLFVVADDTSPTAQELARQTLMQSWGFAVTLIDDGATQTAFDTALADADVAYVSSETNANDIQTKLRATTIGVVNEQIYIIANLQLASGSPVPITLTDASITDNTHYITSPFSAGALTLSSPWQPFYYVNAGVAAGVQQLATVFNKPSLLIAEEGAELLSGAIAPGRRVQLPWGAAGFDFDALNDDGKTIMKRAIEWAAADEPKGWAVGDAGTILHTTDGGATWTSQSSGITDSVKSVFFVDSATGHVVGNSSGILLRTTDGGANWTSTASGTTELFWDVYFPDASTGYAAGQNGALVKTTDGGVNWNPLNAGTGTTLRAVYFVDASTGWIVGLGGVIRKTTDAGATWNPQTSGTADDLLSVAFLDSLTGWIVGKAGTILKTTDGGITWSPQASGTTEDLRNVNIVSGSNSYIVGNVGTILETTDGGANWVPQTSGVIDNIWHVHFLGASTGFAAGSVGTILKTTDGGANWIPQSSGTINNLKSIHFVEGVVGGGGAVCGDGNCDKEEQLTCSCAADCGAPDAFEQPGVTCADGEDNDCDGDTDCADINCGADPGCTICGDSVCESGEDCNSCPGDCPGVTSGKPSNQYCCGNGTAEAPEGDGSICDGNY